MKVVSVGCAVIIAAVARNRECDLNAMAGNYTCGERISFLTQTGSSEDEARELVSSDFPYKCGACANGCVDMQLNGSAWYDSDGPTYNCAWHAKNWRDRCTDSYVNGNLSSNQACCACGGGIGRDPYFDYYCTGTPSPTCGNADIPCFFDPGPACEDGETCCYADGKTPSCRFCNYTHHGTLCPKCPPPPAERSPPEPCGSYSSSSPTKRVCGDNGIACFGDPGCHYNSSLACCLADGEREDCRFCGTGFCPACPANGHPPPKCGTLNGGTHLCNGIPCFWDPDCENGGVGCMADGKHQQCRFCGSELTPPCP